MTKATTVRFTDEMFARLDQASARTGLPVNSIVIAACLEWMQRHTPSPEASARLDLPLQPTPSMPLAGPRWATIKRAMKLGLAHREAGGVYPFDRFSDNAKELLKAAQSEAEKSGHRYIGTEHLLLAAFSPSFSSARILGAIGVERGAVTAALEAARAEKKPKVIGTIIPTSRVKRVIEIAFGICGSMGAARVETGHILLALAAEGEGIAAGVLGNLGATKETIAAQLDQLAEPEP